MSKRKQSRAPEGADKGGQIGQGIARGSTKLVNDRLAAERHLLSRRKSLAVSQAARMPTVSAADVFALIPIAIAFLIMMLSSAHVVGHN